MYDGNTYSKALRLYQRGVVPQFIARKLGVGFETLRRWLKNPPDVVPDGTAEGVYIIQPEGRPFLKVGRTRRSPKQRLEDLANGTCDPHQIVDYILFTQPTENSIHKDLRSLLGSRPDLSRKCRKRRKEWYPITPEVASILEGYGFDLSRITLSKEQQSNTTLHTKETMKTKTHELSVEETIPDQQLIAQIRAEVREDRFTRSKGQGLLVALRRAAVQPETLLNAKTKNGRRLQLSAMQVILTPELARMCLSCLTDKQRTLRTDTVLKYVQAIRTDNWAFCADPLRLTSEGELIDGQHRCMASIVTNTPLDVLVYVGFTEQERDHMDQAKVRSRADIFKSRTGIKDEHMITKTIDWLWAIEHAREMGYVLAQRDLPAELRGESAVSRWEEYYYADNHAEELTEAVAWIKSKPFRRCKKYAPSTFFAAARIVLKKLNEEAADRFFNALLSDGEGPSKAYQEVVIKGKTDFKAEQLFAMLFFAWNDFIDGRTYSVAFPWDLEEKIHENGRYLMPMLKSSVESKKRLRRQGAGSSKRA